MGVSRTSPSFEHGRKPSDTIEEHFLPTHSLVCSGRVLIQCRPFCLKIAQYTSGWVVIKKHNLL